jgi:hypothetical protein
VFIDNSTRVGTNYEMHLNLRMERSMMVWVHKSTELPSFDLKK